MFLLFTSLIEIFSICYLHVALMFFFLLNDHLLLNTHFLFSTRAPVTPVEFTVLVGGYDPDPYFIAVPSNLSATLTSASLVPACSAACAVTVRQCSVLKVQVCIIVLTMHFTKYCSGKFARFIFIFLQFVFIIVIFASVMYEFNA